MWVVFSAVFGCVEQPSPVSAVSGVSAVSCRKGAVSAVKGSGGANMFKNRKVAVNIEKVR